MEAILAIIIEYVAIWAPSLVAVLGVATTVITAISKTKTALEALKKDETIKHMEQKFEEMASQNEELVRCNKLLLDQVTHIKNYADEKKKEG